MLRTNATPHKAKKKEDMYSASLLLFIFFFLVNYADVDEITYI